MHSFLVLALCVWLAGGRDFNPYADNSGTIVGLAGKGYAIIASDTRLSDGYVIRSRNINRLVELDAGRLLFAASGCLSDACGLIAVLEKELESYKWDNADKLLSVHALAHLLSTTLYSRRTFPYYALCVAAGLDDETREGAVYRYDSVGSFERVQATCAGKGEQLIQPMLDEATSMEESREIWKMAPAGDTFLSIPARHDLGVEAACDLVVRVFRSAAEREITVGDGVEIWILEGGKVERRYCFLPRH